MIKIQHEEVHNAVLAGATRRRFQAYRKRKRIRVMHIINRLGIGGAELALFRVMTGANPEEFDMQAITLADGGEVVDELLANGFRVRSIGMGVTRFDPTAMVRLVRLLRAEKPDIVQTWLQQSDLIGGLAAKLARTGPVLWNIRHSTLHPVFTKRRTWMLTKLSARLSPYLPGHIVCCSESSREEQLRMGYSPEKMSVIPNGVDIDRFQPDAEASRSIREELGISSQSLLFGAAGRCHPQKDYPNLIRAANQIAARCSHAHFAFCGEEVTMENTELRALVQASEFSQRFHLLGVRTDVQRFMASLDILVSAACFGEGFPNVISEAMACGVPCIATDIGDSALIVGATGRIVPHEQPNAIAQSAMELIECGQDARRKLGQDARRRILEHFSLPRMIAQYEDLYTEIANRASK